MEIEFQFRAIEQQRWQEVRDRRLAAEAKRLNAESATRVDAPHRSPSPSADGVRPAPRTA